MPQYSEGQKIIPRKKPRIHTYPAPGARRTDKTYYAITIRRKLEDVYSFWRNFRNLSFFMKDISEVRVLTSKKSHWMVKLNYDLKTEWETEIVEERTNEMISWRSLPGSEVDSEGTVWLTKAPGDLGTVVSLAMTYTVPGSKLGEIAAKLADEDPETLVKINLKRLKAYLETGEIPTIEGQPHGNDEKTHHEAVH